MLRCLAVKSDLQFAESAANRKLQSGHDDSRGSIKPGMERAEVLRALCRGEKEANKNGNK